MRIVGAIIGWILVLLACAAAGLDALDAVANGAMRLRPAGEVWYKLDAPSLNLIQAVVERYIWPTLWDPIILAVLQWPLALVFGVPGLLLVLISHKWNLTRRRWRFKK
jgi:ABC-type Fe3+ transport system permease subunit